MSLDSSKSSPLLPYIAPDLRPLAVPVANLVLDPRNARLHPERNLAAIRASLKKFGQRKPVVVHRETGVVLAGNGLVTAARELGWTHVAAVQVDDDPATATAYGLADNRTAELASWNDQVLAELLQEVRDAEGLELEDVGFDDAYLNSLLGTEIPTTQTTPTDEWRGMPEFVNENLSSARKIIVHFRSDEDVADFARLLGQSHRITDKTKSIWFPEEERADFKSQAYVEDDPAL